MGGCRCTFRDCTNNSTHCPEMHFFHYPYKHKGRCTLWGQFADKLEFLTLPDKQLRNKVVCETHFRDECFMNYKKDRLVRQAVPTLVRLSNDLVLDYEEGENVFPKVLEPTKSTHLIPPEKRSSSSNETTSFEITIADSGTDEGKEILPIKQHETNNEEMGTSSGFIIIQEPPTKIHKPNNLTKILNPGAPQNCFSKITPVLSTYSQKRSQVTISSPARSVKKIIKSNINAGQSSEDVLYEIGPKEIQTDPLQIQIQLSENRMTEIVNEVLEEDKVITMQDEDTVEVVSEQPVEEIVKQKIPDNAIYLKTIEEYAMTIEQLKKQLSEKTVQIPAPEPVVIIPLDNKIVQTSTQVETVTTSRKPEPSKGTPLSKAHIFNSIKKYLSPSMMALVRMEMFGGPDRIWKDDEKSVSVELLQLGETVFKHMRDEWRLRLPPIKEVEKWIAESAEILDEDDL